MRVMAGTRQVLADLMEWHQIYEQSEAMTLVLHHLHALGADWVSTIFLVAAPRNQRIENRGTGVSPQEPTDDSEGTW